MRMRMRLRMRNRARALPVPGSGPYIVSYPIPDASSVYRYRGTMYQLVPAGQGCKLVAISPILAIGYLFGDCHADSKYLIIISAE